MAVQFKQETIQEFERIAARYPVRRAALLPALWLAQREFGWISEDAMVTVAKLPKGPIMTADKRVALPPKQQTYGNIEGLMNHFKIIMHGICPAPGEIYDFTEAANGELGFYIVADGNKNPYRVKCRPPCFMNFAAFGEMIEGSMVADAVANLGSINIIAGELDR